jgi:hypothetical protein
VQVFAIASHDGTRLGGVEEVRRRQGTFVVVIVVVDLVARGSAAVADGDILVCLERVFRKERFDAVVEEAFRM